MSEIGSTGSTVGNAYMALLDRTLKPSSIVRDLSECSGEVVASCMVGVSKQGHFLGMNCPSCKLSKQDIVGI